MNQISDIEIIGYPPDLNKEVDTWALHQDGKTVIGMDEMGRTVLLVPRHLCIIRYKYGKEVQ